MKSGNQQKYIVWGGIMGTIIYVFLFLVYLSPENSIMVFLASAPLNERGDFLAGFFSPLAFLWIIIGYFIQSIQLGRQREELSKQMLISGYQFELEKRKQDPEFEVELNGQELLVRNVTTSIAKKVHVYCIHHGTSKSTIIGMVNRLIEGSSIIAKLEDWMPVPRYLEEESEILIMYDTQMDDMRAQRFNFIWTNNARSELIAWQIGSSGPLPEYFDKY